MKVGIIGAGVSGVVAGGHLGKANVDYIVFERSSAPGGVWLYDDRIDVDPTYPAIWASGGNNIASNLDLANDDLEIKHAPPGPCYEGLTNNVSTRLLKLQLNSWPPETADYVNHRVINEYLRDTSEKAGVHERTIYNTKVENIEKSGIKWRLKTTTLTRDGTSSKKLEQTWSFDAVVIASGHYHVCRIPNIPGLAEWKRKWPSRVQHSKSYRRASPFKGQNVLLIGAGTSSTDIARELEGEAGTVYQTSRDGPFDLPPSLLPANAQRVSDVESFEGPVSTDSDNDLSHSEPIPYQVVLRDKRVLTNIHRVIVCTGYHISLPFLSDYHSDGTPASQASDTILVTDGTQLHNLHKDIFYIPDPTLTFIGVPYFSATFTLFEFQAVALAAVLSGKAHLPSQEEMRNEYRERLQKKGSGKVFHSLRGEEINYVKTLVEWVNRDGQKLGAKPVEGHTAAWHTANGDRLKLLEEKLGRKFLEPDLVA